MPAVVLTDPRERDASGEKLKSRAQKRSPFSYPNLLESMSHRLSHSHAMSHGHLPESYNRAFVVAVVLNVIYVLVEAG